MAVISRSPGKASIKEAYVYTTLGNKRVDITKYAMHIDVYEDIYAPFVYCDIVLIDYNQFAAEFPLAGEEYFVFTWQSEGGKLCRYHFLLYKNDTGGYTPTQSAKGYVLRGVTLERAFDSGKTVSRSFTGSYSDIAAAIFDTYIASDAGGLGVEYEPSRSIGRFVAPQWSPLKCIDYCRKRAVSRGEARSPFVFFRNTDGYRFMSLNGLFNTEMSKPSAQVVHRYSAKTTSAMFDEKQEPGVVADIIAFDIVSYYDTVAKIDMGTYNTHGYSFDLTTKSFVLRQQFNMSDTANKFQFGGGNSGVHNRLEFMQNFDNTRCVALYVPTDVGLELASDDTKTQKDLYPDYMAEMAAYTGMVGEYNVQYTIYGDSNVSAGQVMTINVPTASDVGRDEKSARKADMLFSGSFLLARVKHSFEFNEQVDYSIRISGINGSRSVKTESLQ